MQQIENIGRQIAGKVKDAWSAVKPVSEQEFLANLPQDPQERLTKIVRRLAGPLNVLGTEVEKAGDLSNLFLIRNLNATQTEKLMIILNGSDLAIVHSNVTYQRMHTKAPPGYVHIQVFQHFVRFTPRT
ncbi:MAG TPA: hypothetical protein VFG51_01550 [Candidatus Saccharimonadia bacterium]|nr:hypothetical protein [Candidatus Saccharimonadia bacterium]